FALNGFAAQARDQGVRYVGVGCQPSEEVTGLRDVGADVPATVLMGHRDRAGGVGDFPRQSRRADDRRNDEHIVSRTRLACGPGKSAQCAHRAFPGRRLLITLWTCTCCPMATSAVAFPMISP